MQDSKVKSLAAHRLKTIPRSPQPVAAKPRLLDQVREAIRMRHYSIKTEYAYVGWIKRFILFHKKRHPTEMAEKEISQFLTNLAINSRVSATTQNQALNALLFLYNEVLRKEIGYVNGVVRAKRSRRVPVVLTREEVRSLLSHLDSTQWLMAHCFTALDSVLWSVAVSELKMSISTETRLPFGRARGIRTATRCFPV